MKPIIRSSAGILLTGLLLFITQPRLYAQIPPNAVNADPSAKAISQVPLGQNILGTAVLRFRFTNEATSTNATGQIPANSVRLTISFPGQYAYTSVNAIPKFVVEDFDNGAFGVVHLVNNAMIDEGEVVDLQLNVRGLVSGSGTVTFNSDRVTPVIVGNTQTANDNASATFTVTGTLPITLERFTASGQQCNVKLSWATSAELNIDHFEVEMSNDGNGNYTRIGSVASTGGAGLEAAYNFNYTMQNENTHLFRLKIVGKDGKVVHTYIARINSGCKQGKDVVLLYPSPASSTVTLNVSDMSLINTRASIFSANGKKLTDFIITGNTVNVNISKYSSGVYFVKLSNGVSVRFVKD
ncbi:T9SS type A sorting domain-containing protein [Ferruginibacter sp. HRS2-29]|uniref:T9SS type A sorting domain-containing protein n=1 Tax=Ferruginibacter sp. HRS2-29 TaxID=2487334 RepID=UPI0020CB9AAC|nr:T9SS type A sorting domain-containing protein [Ferruginibacter sp. HRS2-29]MCP9753334.1 T9SS C-terminal target domain-containing protein [Ferruginibacter sp. HRS2-29]